MLDKELTNEKLFTKPFEVVNIEYFQTELTVANRQIKIIFACYATNTYFYFTVGVHCKRHRNIVRILRILLLLKFLKWI